MGLFTDRIKNNGKTQIPVWFMRQAGRYHQHYQNIKKNSDFMTMCKNPRLAADVTLGPIEEFKFDAAILFSDLLFPLEHLGLGLSYHSGPPTLEVKLDTLETIQNLKEKAKAQDFYAFQGQALEILKKELPSHVTRLGFVGSPFTLYTYACEGAHSGQLINSKKGLFDGRFKAFLEKLRPQLLQEMLIQAKAGADAVCLFDTAAGELAPRQFQQFVAPAIREITGEFKRQAPECKVVYYSKFTHLDYLKNLNAPAIDVLGIDWRCNLKEALTTLGEQYYIQGNLDPSLLHLPWTNLEGELKAWWDSIKDLPKDLLSHWIAGLGHGVLQHTPEENVKKTVAYIHENFCY